MSSFAKGFWIGFALAILFAITAIEGGCWYTILHLSPNKGETMKAGDIVFVGDKWPNVLEILSVGWDQLGTPYVDALGQHVPVFTIFRPLNGHEAGRTIRIVKDRQGTLEYQADPNPPDDMTSYVPPGAEESPIAPAAIAKLKEVGAWKA